MICLEGRWLHHIYCCQTGAVQVHQVSCVTSPQDYKKKIKKKSNDLNSDDL